LFINDVSVNEGDSGTTALVFTITLAPASAQRVSVRYTTQDGTGSAAATVANDDYIPDSNTVTFEPGQTTKNITILAKGDTFNEVDEFFTVELSSPTNADFGDSSGKGTIVKDDKPTISIDDVEILEGNAGEQRVA